VLIYNSFDNMGSSTMFGRMSKRGKTIFLIFTATLLTIFAYAALSMFGFENGLYYILIIPVVLGLLTFYDRVYRPFKEKSNGNYPHNNSNSDREPIPANLRHEVFQRDSFRCRECGATNKETQLEVDHIKPVSKGGTNNSYNLQTLCKKCNRSKYTRRWTGGKTKRI